MADWICESPVIDGFRALVLEALEEELPADAADWQEGLRRRVKLWHSNWCARVDADGLWCSLQVDLQAA
jgi:hypothetical protein